MLADGSIFIAAGSKTGMDLGNNEVNNPTYEILNRDGTPRGNSIQMDFLIANQPNNLYPFLHLLRSGNLFVFCRQSSQIFNVFENRIVKQLPECPGYFRTYPNTGGSVLLPLTSQNGYTSEVMVCGGGSGYGLGSPTDATCGRIQPEHDNPAWRISHMPSGRTMVEGTLLPDGTVLWLNGAKQGFQGWGTAQEPAHDALIYDPQQDTFTTSGTSTIARLYHSVALLLQDGRVLIAGSNPSWGVVFPDQVNPSIPTLAFPTEFRVEIYTPPYLSGVNNAQRRPTGVHLSTMNLVPNGMAFEVTFKLTHPASECKVVLYHGGFVTHSLHMGQRMVYLDHDGWEAGAGNRKEVKLTVKMVPADPGYNVTPPGPYFVYVTVDGVPSHGVSVMVV